MGTVLIKPLAVSLLLAVFLLGTLDASGISSDGDEKQVYIVYMGHQHQHEPSESTGGFSAAEAAHHKLLNQILDDGRSSSLIHWHKEIFSEEHEN